MFILLPIGTEWELEFGFADVKEYRTHNYFEHVDWLLLLLAANCVAFGFMIIFLFVWVDSLYVNLLFALGMALTWPLEVILGFEEFQTIRLMILFAMVLGVAGYQLEGKLQKQKPSAEEP